MHRTDTIPGTPARHDNPEWRPLVELLGPDLAGWFMWMYEIDLVDASRVHAYKHVATRRYIHLAEDGRAFLYCADARYREIPRHHAIAQAFSGWERLCQEPGEAQPVRVALRRALRAARTVPRAPVRDAG